MTIASAKKFPSIALDKKRCTQILKQNTNDFMKKSSLKKTWAVGVAEGQGLFEFVRSCVIE
jgi:hypothetical protein